MKTEVLERVPSKSSSTKGYKQTEVGWIPEDWELGELGNLFDFIGGSQPPRSTFISNEKVGYIRLLQIRDYKTENYLTYIPISLARRFCSSDDIMIGRYGPPIFQILRGLGGAYNVALIRAIPIGFLDNALAWHILKQESLFNFVEKLSQRSSGQTGVDLVQLKGYKIPLPKTKTEQTAIATALSDADALIRSLEQLIEKKKNIKQGAMQELLRPQEGWELKYLTDVVDYIHGKAHEKDIVEDGKFTVVNSKFVSTEGKIAKYSNSNYCPARKNDVLTVLSDLPNGKALAKCYIVQEDGRYAINQRICIWRTKGSDPTFLYYLLNRNKYFLDLDDGVSQTHILNHHIEKCQISIPLNFEVQKEIGLILFQMDAEINKLHLKLEKQRHIKQGMMQNLLTGKIRLI